jgi:hypothetical protein
MLPCSVRNSGRSRPVVQGENAEPFATPGALWATHPRTMAQCVLLAGPDGRDDPS